VRPQRTIEKANENHTDEMIKDRSEHFTVLFSPSHSTDLDPCYINLFLKLNKHLRGHHILSHDEVKTTVKINFCQQEVQVCCDGLEKLPEH
jgi:hypothetical protein